jgi:hypothetical protein
MKSDPSPAAACANLAAVPVCNYLISNALLLALSEDAETVEW